MRIELAQLLDELDQVVLDLGDGKIDELMTVCIELAREHARRQREDGAVGARSPSFGQTKREHEHMQLFEHPPNRRQEKSCREQPASANSRNNVSRAEAHTSK